MFSNNSSLFVFILLLLNLNLKAQQLSLVVNLKDNLTTPKYFIGFGVRTNTTTGHSFVILGKENEDQQRSEIYLRGFYPRRNGFPFDKGQIIDEFKNHNFVSGYDHIIFVIDAQDFNRAKKLVRDSERSPQLFNIVTNNCIDLAQSTMGTIGLKLPPSFGSTPSQFIHKVADALQKGGIEYKVNSLVVLNFLSTEIYENRNNIDNGMVQISSGFDIQTGRVKNGKLNGIVKTENVKFGKALINYNDGVPDFANIEFLDRKFFKEIQRRNSVFKASISTKIENYSNSASRRIQFDLTTGNKVSGLFITNGTVCNETYFTEDSLFSSCTDPENNTFESDIKIIIEDGQIKFVPSSNRMKIKNKNYLFNGIAMYINKKLYQKGKIVFSNGDTYSGELLNGKFHGKGVYNHTESPTKILGFKVGNSGSYTKSGTWTNGIFDIFGNSPPNIDPRQGVATGNEFHVDPPSPVIQDNSVKPNPAPNNVALNNPPVKQSSIKKGNKIKLRVKNAIWDPNAKKWILL